MKKLQTILLVLCLFYTANILAGTIKVTSISQLTTAIASAVAGDTIVVTDGVYTTTSSMSITRVGTSEKPIIITAETIGGVEIKGSGGFTLNNGAAYIIIKGFKFTHNTGITRVNTGANHCTITRNIFECAANGTGNKPYLRIDGDDCEVSYNTFQNKATEGPMVYAPGPGASGMPQRTWIHHNYFYKFINKGFNNCSAIQIGLSGNSLKDAHSIVEYNLFIDCAGENEGIVANKSCKNIYRYNTFGEGSTELSLRHGNFCEVYGNFFLGNDGLRFCADDHIIYNNYFEGCSYAINCVNGDGVVPPEGTSLLTAHDRPDRVKIYNNTLVNNATNFGMPGRTNGLGAIEISFSNNIIQGGTPISISTPYTNPTWEGNILWNMPDGIGQIPEGGYTLVDPQLESDANGIYHIKSTSPAINASAGTYPAMIEDLDGQARVGLPDVGADEYSTSAITNQPITLAEVGAFAGMVLTAPEPPSELTAVAVSDRQINLTWKDNSSNETNFLIQRSYNGTDWTTLTSAGANTTSYSDFGLDPLTKYYYQIRAEFWTAYSNFSNIVNATTDSLVQTMSPSWFDRDIGITSPAGSAKETNGVFTISGSGADTYSNSDQFHYVYQSLSGDGEIIARVDSLVNTHEWAKAGVMIRETLGATSAYVMNIITPLHGINLQYKITTGGSGNNVIGSAVTVPYWLKLMRKGDLFTAYDSPDGVVWKTIGTATVKMPTNVFTGLMITSHNAPVLSTTKMSNVSVTSDTTGDPHIWIEAESSIVEEPMKVKQDFTASAGVYVICDAGKSTSSAPLEGRITYKFNVVTEGLYKIWARVQAPTTDDDSYWVQVDNNPWVSWNEIEESTNWVWDELHDSNNGKAIVKYNLATGSHTLTLAYREDGTLLDKFLITRDSTFNPNSSAPVVGVVEYKKIIPDGFILHNAYPNPFNPTTVISYQLPVLSNVTLKIYDMLGREVSTLVDQEQQPGFYRVNFNSRNSANIQLTSGIYFARLTAKDFSKTIKLLLMK